MLALANSSSGSWAKAAIDTNTRISTQEIEIDFTAPASLHFDCCLDGSVLSSAHNVCSVTECEPKNYPLPSQPGVLSRAGDRERREIAVICALGRRCWSYAKELNLKGRDETGYR
jgi:hypothetical protein